jgi:16S rRNA (cytidine1402-2'-O)-methyltransferase
MAKSPPPLLFQKWWGATKQSPEIASGTSCPRNDGHNGILYIVSTPIGNLKDITLRAIETLKSVDLIAAEDTRHTKRLLSHYDIHAPLTSYFEHNQVKKADYIIAQLKAGKNIALVSDAGTPGISDPGYVIINRAIKEGIKIEAMPGPCALITGLVLSGLPADKFVFEGFLSAKSTARIKRLRELALEKRTIILYESVHRILKTLKNIAEVMPDSQMACGREITKIFEGIVRAKPRDILLHFEKNPPKGEFILIIKP